MHMKKKMAPVIILILLGFSGGMGYGQSLTEYLEECELKYGSDADLVNGEKYFYPYSSAEGDPFFHTGSDLVTLIVKGKEFPGQSLRYDIYNQLLVLDYKDVYGGTTSLVLRNEWVESFYSGTMLFKGFNDPEGVFGFYQVLMEGRVSCIYKWSKEYQLNLNSGQQNYYFTEGQKSAFLLIEDQFYPFKSTRSFLKAFDEIHQKEVKQFIRQSKINLRNTPDSQMRHLIEFCNSLPHEDS
jgi:hypothetical protein